MGFIDTLKERAKANVKTIVLPETEDKRTLAATEKILKEGIAKVILVGNEEAVKKSAAEDGYDISGAQIVDPATSEKTQGYIDKLVELRQKKGMTIEGLADAVGLSYSYMGELERGKRNPTLRVVENLAVVLETPPTALLAESHS